MVSMTSYWDAYKLDIPMQWNMAMAMAMAMAMVMAIAMVMMSRKRKLPSMPPSQDEGHTMIGDFTESTVSDSDNDLHFVRVMSARLMVRCRTFRKWRYGGRCYFGYSFLFSSLYFCTSLDLGPVQMALAQVFVTSGDKSSGGGVSLCTGSTEWLP